MTLAAREMLAMIADPEDIERLVRLDTPKGEFGFRERWRYSITTALIHPSTNEGWDFLARCARNDFGDWWLVGGAHQSLRWNGSERSKAILAEASRKSSEIAARAEKLQTGALPPGDPDLATAARGVAQALGPKTWQGNEPPRFNQAADKALIDLTFQTGWDRLVYTATFHKTGGKWVLRNVYETLQGFSPMPPPSAKP